jgi:hypothetical protein
MLIARIGGFVGNGTDLGFENDIDNIAQRDVVMMRSLVIAPAQMDPARLVFDFVDRIMANSIRLPFDPRLFAESRRFKLLFGENKSRLFILDFC